MRNFLVIVLMLVCFSPCVNGETQITNNEGNFQASEIPGSGSANQLDWEQQPVNEEEDCILVLSRLNDSPSEEGDKSDFRRSVRQQMTTQSLPDRRSWFFM
jgi:hypothetical protein